MSLTEANTEVKIEAKPEVKPEVKIEEKSGNAVDPDKCLARIVKVLSIDPIEKADQIVLAKVLGWQCIVNKKYNFKVGDLGIYFRIDSLLEYNENTKFLNNKPLKTVTMRGVLSQGLLAPLDWLNDYMPKEEISKLTEDADVTDIMKVKKHVFDEELEALAEGKGGKRLPFPTYCVRTDEDRAQNNPKVLATLLGKEIVITRKMDGCSTTFAYYKGVFTVCGRSCSMEVKNNANNHYFTGAEKYKIEEGMKALNLNIAIQGETMGPKINGGRTKKNYIDFMVYNIWDINEQHYMTYEQCQEIITKLGLQYVPVIYKGPCLPQHCNVPDLLKLADEQEYGKGISAEGIVVKTNYWKEQPRHSFKVISNNYLKKYKL